ncbi:MAG: PD-(D/E)XK nuclease family protein, partial [Candidatus Margulisiibacteriota bacterium]
MLLLGRPGSGKTTIMIERFLEAGNPGNYLIVPTLEHARRVRDLMFSRFGRQGFWALEKQVLTFDKFAKNLLAKEAQALEPCTEAAKLLLISQAIKANELEYFREVKEHKGFLRGLMELFAELKRSLIFPVDLKTLLEKAGSKMTAKEMSKAAELLTIYTSYQDLMHKEKLIEDQDLLPMLLRSGAGGIQDKKIYIDGFFEFTPAQEDAIKFLSGKATLTIRLPLAQEQLSYPAFKWLLPTYEFLLNLGFQVKELPDDQRSKNEELKRLNKYLFSTAGDISAGEKGITVISAQGTVDQVKQTAREIKRLVASGKYRYSDVALILRNIGQFNSLLPLIFAEYQIPLNIHEGEKLLDDPLARSISELLDLLQGQGSAENLIGNLALEPVQQVVEKAKSAMARAGSVREMNDLFKQLLKSLWGNKTAEFTLADNTACKKFLAISAEFAELETRGLYPVIGLNTYCAYLQEAMEDSLFSVQHLNTDEVQIYDCHLMQQKEYKIVFICELVEKAFPQRASEDVFFKDRERRLFNELGGMRLKLMLSASDKEQLLFYLAVTRAEEKLYLCTRRADEKGREVLSSYFLKHVQALFLPESIGKIDSRDLKLSDKEFPLDETELWRSFLQNLVSGKEEPVYLQLYNYLLKQSSARLSSIWQRTFLQEKRETLLPQVAAILNSKRQSYSASALEAFVACPYKYFCQYGLKIEEPVTGLDYKARGSLVHKVLERFMRGEPGEEELRIIYNEESPAFLRQVQPDYLSYS